MKYVLAIAITFLANTASADLVHQFKNPSFSGVGYSAHVLSLEQLQFNRQQEIDDAIQAEQDRVERELENSTLNKFIKNIESRIYATLSKQMVDNMFAACGADTGVDCSNTGSTEIEGAEITWTRDSATGGITLSINSPDGFTEITIPGPGEFTF